jgi:hypothetical protein
MKLEALNKFRSTLSIPSAIISDAGARCLLTSNRAKPYFGDAMGAAARPITRLHVHEMRPFDLGFSECLAKRLVPIVGTRRGSLVLGVVDERADRHACGRSANASRADPPSSCDAFPAYHNSTEPVAPYLRSTIRERGAFGTSRTRVYPPRADPGHVALIGAFFDTHVNAETIR